MMQSRSLRLVAAALLLVAVIIAVVLLFASPTRKTVIIVPEGYDGREELTVVVWLHGWDGSPADKQALFQRLANSHRIAFVGVSGPIPTRAGRYGWTDMFNDDHQRVQNALAEAAKQIAFRPRSAIALGFSQGALIGIQAAVFQPDVFAGAISVSAGTSAPIELDLIPDKSALPRQRFVIICGAKEAPESLQQSKALSSWLRAAKATVVQPEYPNHDLHSFPLDFDERLPEWLRFVEHGEV